MTRLTSLIATIAQAEDSFLLLAITMIALATFPERQVQILAICWYTGLLFKMLKDRWL